MGITGNHARYLIHARKMGVAFDKILMLGRQQLYIDQPNWNNLKTRLQVEQEEAPKSGTYAEAFFTMLGASKVDSMDYSDFESASIIHDLNVPVPATLREKFSVVFDGGTLEHVFNYPVAIKGCMDMVRIGGHFIAITPTNNFCGHGFYQFSPELLFGVLSPAHGFKIKSLLVLIEQSETNSEWYEVKNPQEVRSRVLLENSLPVSVLVLAEKIASTEGIVLRPMQSDYFHIWNVHDSLRNKKNIEGESKLLHLYRRFTPDFIKSAVRDSRNAKLNKTSQVGLLGMVNPDFFNKIEL